VARRPTRPQVSSRICDNTVQDNVTGLRWQRFPSDLVTQAEAVTFCGGLTLASVRWRVPTVLELGSIVDETRRDPALDPVFLTRASGGGDLYWSSTVVRAAPGNYYRVDAQLGYVRGASVSNRLVVRCVAI
jgi:hypothetical protein